LKKQNTDRFFCKNSSGNDLFYVDLSFIAEQGIIFLEFSFSYNWSILEFNKVVDQISTEIFIDERRLCLIALLFVLAKNTPEISVQISNNLLNEIKGIENDSYSNLLKELIASKDFPDYSVFSSTSNSIYFDYLKPIIENSLLSSADIEKVDKSLFEKLIAQSMELARAYVENFTCSIQYFVLKRQLYPEICNFYFMTESFKVILIFIVKESSK
jgi:hypothetical protein